MPGEPSEDGLTKHPDQCVPAVLARACVGKPLVLKRIFEKTRTRRQAELVLVLMQVACVGLAPAQPSE